MESARRADSEEPAALWQANAALREAEFGNAMAARQNAMTALSLAPGKDVTTMAALALVRAGDVAQAQRLANNLDRDFPQNTIVQSYWLPAIRAAIELDAKNSAKALELLKPAAPFELGQSQPFLVGLMYPAYLRGQAYLQARNGKEAAAAFQRIIHHGGIVLNFPLAARWPTSDWRAPPRFKVIPRMPVWPTKSSSSFGRAPISTSLSSRKPKRSTRGCDRHSQRGKIDSLIWAGSDSTSS